MIKLKPEVVTAGVQAQIWYALGRIDQIHRDMFDGASIIVTSLCDGQHSPTSLHPKGLAADIRVRDIGADNAYKFYQACVIDLRKFGYDIVAEGGAPSEVQTMFTRGEHLHVEWDPKAGAPDFIERTAEG